MDKSSKTRVHAAGGSWNVWRASEGVGLVGFCGKPHGCRAIVPALAGLQWRRCPHGRAVKVAVLNHLKLWIAIHMLLTAYSTYELDYSFSR